MKRAAIAGFTAGVAMMIGGALAAVSSHTDATPADSASEVMNPMIGARRCCPTAT